MPSKFNSKKSSPPPYCLTIAGLDPCGGAGATADLRVFRRLGAYGLCALTALTPQNTRGVIGIHPVDTRALSQELDGIFEDFPGLVAKTGQIPTRDLAMLIVRKLRKHPVPLVIDPVMVPTRGRKLVDDDALSYMRRHLLGLATIITPNLEEAAWLANMEISSRSDMERAARELVPNIAKAAVLTGGDGIDEGAWDLFFDGETMRWMRTARRNVGDIHGSGCHYSSALCAFIAKKLPLVESVVRTKRFINDLIDGHLIDPTGEMKIIHS